MRKRYCCIISCENYRGCTDFENMSFFRLPIFPTQRQEWLDEINKHQKIEGSLMICQLHFEDKHMKFANNSRKGKLTSTAVPTIFKPNPLRPVSIFEPIIKVEPVDHNEVALLSDDYNPQPKRQRLVEEPTESRPRPCNKCIQLDVVMQGQKVKMERLQATCDERSKTIKALKAELARCKSKIRMSPAIVLEKCSVCRIKYSSSDGNHICDGRKGVSCDYCAVPFTSIADLVEHLTYQHEEKQFFKCDKCPQIYSMALLLQFHGKCHPNIGVLIQCDACDTKCLTQHQLKNHKDECHSSDVIFKPFQCGKCGKSFVEAAGLQIHMTRLHDKLAPNSLKFECFICKVKLKTLYDTRIHLKLHERPEKCAVCSENFTKTEIDVHMCSGLKNINCVYCKTSFKATKFLLQHLKEDCKSEKFIYKCDTCPKYYPMKTLRDIHVNQGHSDEQKTRPFLCDLCPKRYGSVTHLQTHRRRHLMTRDHLCEECGKGFISLRNLLIHKLCHGEKNFGCDKCGVRFVREVDLKRHHRRRHDRNKFVCSICNITLTSLEGLTAHTKIHTRTEADRKHACTKCPQKFFDIEHLHRHLRQTHSTARPFECEICKQTYKYKGDLTKHIRLTHS